MEHSRQETVRQLLVKDSIDVRFAALIKFFQEIFLKWKLPFSFNCYSNARASGKGVRA